MDLDQLSWGRYIQLHSFILSQRGDLVKIHRKDPSRCRIRELHAKCEPPFFLKKKIILNIRFKRVCYRASLELNMFWNREHTNKRIINVYAVEYAVRLGFLNFSKLAFPKFRKPNCCCVSLSDMNSLQEVRLATLYRQSSNTPRIL